MLSRENRLPKDTIKEVLRRGLIITGESLTLRYKKTTTPPRFAFVVSSKIDKRATARNRMRRILSESVRRMMPPIDGVLVVRKNISGLSQKEVRPILEKIFNEVAHT